MPLPSRTDIVETGSYLPHAKDIEIVSTDNLAEKTCETNMIAFLNPNDPASILSHPILGPSIKNKREELFVEDENGIGLRNPVVTVLLDPPIGSIKFLHLTMGGKMDGEPYGNVDFEIPKIWRAVAERLKRTLADIPQQEESNGLCLYFDGEIARSSNFPHALRSFAQGEGNVSYREDMFKSGSPDLVKSGIRDQVFALVLLVTDFEMDDSYEKDYKTGDMISRVQSLARFLAECPANLLTCEVFTEVLQKMVGELKGNGSPISIETYTTEDAMVKIDKDRVKLDGDLEDKFSGNILQSIHAGAPESGPFLVRAKYRPEQAKGKPVKVIVGKSIMFDNGGNSNHKGAGAAKMEGDMIGGAAIAAEMARVCEEKTPQNIDFVFPIAVNLSGSGARNIEDILKSSSGQTTRETNTDFEGRESLAEGVAMAIQLLKEEGSELLKMTTIGGLSKQSAELGGHRSVVYDKDRKRLRALEDRSTESGDRMIGTQIVNEDYQAVRDPKASFQNFPGGGRFPLTRDGARAAAYIASVANLDPEIPYTHFDIASALVGGQGLPDDIKKADIPVDGFLQTLHEHLKD